MAPEKRGLATSIVKAGGSFGQFLKLERFIWARWRRSTAFSVLCWCCISPPRADGGGGWLGRVGWPRAPAALLRRVEQVNMLDGPMLVTGGFCRPFANTFTRCLIVSFVPQAMLVVSCPFFLGQDRQAGRRTDSKQ